MKSNPEVITLLSDELELLINALYCYEVHMRNEPYANPDCIQKIMQLQSKLTRSNFKAQENEWLMENA